MTNDTYRRRNPKVMPSRKRVEADLSVQGSSQMWRHLGVRFPRRPITLLEKGLRWPKGLGHHKQTCSNSHLSCLGHHLMQLNAPSLPFCRIIFTACRRAFWMAKARRSIRYRLHSGRYRFCIIIREGTSHREGQRFKFKCEPLHELAWSLKSHFTRDTDAVCPEYKGRTAAPGYGDLKRPDPEEHFAALGRRNDFSGRFQLCLGCFSWNSSGDKN